MQVHDWSCACVVSSDQRMCLRMLLPKLRGMMLTRARSIEPSIKQSTNESLNVGSLASGSRTVSGRRSLTVSYPHQSTSLWYQDLRRIYTGLLRFFTYLSTLKRMVCILSDVFPCERRRPRESTRESLMTLFTNRAVVSYV